MSDDIFIAVTTIVLALLFIGFFRYWTLRSIAQSNNDTKKFVTTQKTAAEVEISKIKHEDKRLEMNSKERVCLLEKQAQENLKQMDIQMHLSSQETARIGQELRLKEVTTVQTSLTTRTQLKCETTKEGAQLQFKSNMKSLETMETLTRTKFQLEGATTERMAALEEKRMEIGIQAEKLIQESSRYISDNALTAQVHGHDTFKSIADMEIKAKTDMDKVNASIRREQNHQMFRLGQQQITSTENCQLGRYEFKRFEAREKTERVVAQSISSSIQGVAQIAGSLNGIKGAIGPLASQILGTNSQAIPGGVAGLGQGQAFGSSMSLGLGNSLGSGLGSSLCSSSGFLGSGLQNSGVLPSVSVPSPLGTVRIEEVNE